MLLGAHLLQHSLIVTVLRIPINAGRLPFFDQNTLDLTFVDQI